MDLYLPGSYNHWNADDVGVKAEADGKNRFVVSRYLAKGLYRFKVAADGGWEKNWGGVNTGRLVAPLNGTLVPSGEDIILNAPESGTFTVRVDLAKLRFQIDVQADPPGLPGALTGCGENAHLQQLLMALESSNGGGVAASTIAELLNVGKFHGVLPGRMGERVLLAYRAPEWEHVLVAPSWRGWANGILPLGCIPGTDIHGTVVAVPPGVHSYKMLVNGEWKTDPSNRWVTPDGVPVPPCFNWGASTRCSAFRPLESGANLLWYPTFQSAVRYNERNIWIWLPPTYLSDPNRRYRTLYVTDGNEALTRNLAHQSAWELMRQGEAEDAILVFVDFADSGQRIYEYSDKEGREAYAQFFVRELVPYIDSRFRTRTEAADRGISGVSLGGNFSCYTAFNYPNVFGHAAGQGTSWQWDDWDTLNMFRMAKKAKPISLYADSSYPTLPGGPEDSCEPSRQAVDWLRKLGYAVHHVERAGKPHDWPSWKERFPEIVRWFSPVTTAPRPRKTP